MMSHLYVRSYSVVVLLLLAGLPAFGGGFTITPNFGDTIKNDANASQIEGTINSVIAMYESAFLDPIHVNITFGEMGSGLGESDFMLYPYDYTYFRSQLAADATSVDDSNALAHLPGGSANPVTGTQQILIKSANAKALGFSPIADGTSDGTILFNASITNPGLNGTVGSYDLRMVIEHEIDEILGLGSTLGTETKEPFNTQPSPEDFFRYHSDGTRSFTTASPSGPSQYSYFSIDGATDLAQFDNSGTHDYGDWLSGATVAQVQDAVATTGVNPGLGVELRALDVIGYDVNTVPEPTTWLLCACGFAFLMAVQRRGKGACPCGRCARGREIPRSMSRTNR